MGLISGFLDVSLDAANRLYTWGWGLSVSGAAVTMIGIGMLWVGTRVRDHDFDTTIAALNTEAGQARQRAGNLEERSAGLENEAAQARLEQERLKAQLAWRRITREQHDSLVAALRNSPTNLRLSHPDDPEASLSASEIEKSLVDAGWMVSNSTGFWTPQPSVGIFVGPESDKEPHPLARALGNIGFNVTIQSGSQRTN
jgi:hypothetical protein